MVERGKRQKATKVSFLLAGPSWCQPLPVILQPHWSDICSIPPTYTTSSASPTPPSPIHACPTNNPTLSPSPALQLPLPLTNNNRMKSPSFSSHPPLKTALSVMPTSYEVWLRGMQFAIAIVCRDDDRGELQRAARD